MSTHSQTRVQWVERKIWRIPRIRPPHQEKRLAENRKKRETHQPAGQKVGDGQHLSAMQPPERPDRVLTLGTIDEQLCKLPTFVNGTQHCLDILQCYTFFTFPNFSLPHTISFDDRSCWGPCAARRSGALEVQGLMHAVLGIEVGRGSWWRVPGPISKFLFLHKSDTFIPLWLCPFSMFMLVVEYCSNNACMFCKLDLHQ